MIDHRSQARIKIDMDCMANEARFLTHSIRVAVKRKQIEAMCGRDVE